MGNLRRPVYGDEVHEDLRHPGNHDCSCGLLRHADPDAGHHRTGASKLPQRASAGKGGEEVSFVEIKRIYTESSLPHDDVVVGGRLFLCARA